VLGEPPAPKNVPKEKEKGRSESGGGIELGGSFDDLAASLSKFKMPRISGATAGITAGVILLTALGIWLFARQSLATRADIVARAVMAPDGIKTVMDVSVPESALDVIQWHSEANKRYNDLKMALGMDSGVSMNVLSDGSNGPAVISVIYSAEGTRLGNAGLEALHPNPSLASTSSTLEEHLYFVKDTFGNWLLDGTRTFNEMKSLHAKR
jgi:hypothetical protein